MISRVVIIGLGLIGGSLARALRKRGLCEEIIACDDNEEAIRPALTSGIVDAIAPEWGTALEDADLVVLAVPVGSVTQIMYRIAPSLRKSTLVTDVGSTKVSVIRDLQTVCGGVVPNFVPGHPIAGNDKSGFLASDAELFEGKKVVLTPLAETSPTAIGQITELWQGVGARVVEMKAERHDAVFAATSHLPHVLAYTLVAALAELQEQDQIFEFSGGGLRDFTRIASSDARMWRDICVENQEQILRVLSGYQEVLEQFTQMLEHADSEAIQALFEKAKSARDRHLVNSD